MIIACHAFKSLDETAHGDTESEIADEENLLRMVKLFCGGRLRANCTVILKTALRLSFDNSYT
jgi:hypothetical protein